MPYKDPEQAKTQRQAHYLANREAILARCRADYLISHPAKFCIDCGDRIRINSKTGYCQMNPECRTLQERMQKTGSVERNNCELCGTTMPPTCKYGVCTTQAACRKLGNWRRRTWLQYGLHWQDYERILIQQDGKCALCLRGPDPGKQFNVDHDHRTGRIRGLLCSLCNRRVLGGACRDQELGAPGIRDYALRLLSYAGGDLT